MPRLVTKFKYLKPGTGGRSVGGYARYIATREGAERIDDSHRHAPATQKQQALIEKILRDFPDTKQSHEYRDYQQERTVGNASEFISMAMEENLNAVANTKTYADYIATRPRAERFGSHGLFTDDGVEVQLSEVSKELNAYRGNVYTAILSLKREDAARLGFDHGSRWRDFLRGQTPTLSENLRIPMNHLRWYAAFHNEGHHPHVHLIAYSTVPGEGHLSTKGVEKMRSVFAREIFSQELMFTYQQQTEYRDRLREQGRERVSEIVAKINAGEYLNPRIKEVCVMADKEKYVIKIQGQLVEVSPEVYYAYFHMERQERWQEEKQQEHGVMSYDALDNAETVGQENIADAGSPGLEENIIAEELRSRVRHAVAALPKAERELIQAIYYEGLSERVYAKQHGISQRGANKQRRKILSKLKMFLDFMGIF